jgi:hypothetical protein
MSQTKAQLISDLVQALNFTGTASAPANGAFLSAANTLALATNSAQRLTIDSSGNVGIGTTSPNRHLHLHESDSTGATVRFTNTTTGSGENDGLTVGINSSEQAEFWQRENTAMVFGTNNTQRMAISASGNVGIGAASPNTTLHLDASTGAVLQLQRTASNASNRFTVSVDGTNGTLDSSNATLFRNNGSERMRIDSSGNVGIGTTSPGSKLQIATTAVDTDVFRIMRQDNTGISLFRVFQDSSSGGGTGGCHINSSNRDLMISASTNGDADDGLYLKTTGELGIGTSSPTHMLDISGSNPILALNDTDTTNDRFRLTYNGGSSQLQVDPNNVRSGSHLLVAVDGTERMRIDSSGRVLIGTTSGSDALVVDGGSDAGTITTNSTNSNGNMMTFNCSGTGKFFIGSAGSFITGNSGTTNQGIRAEGSLLFAAGGHTERMRIDSSGNVLIGVNTTGSTSEGMTIRPGNESTLFRDSGFVFLIGGGQSGQRLIDFRQGGTSIGHISKSGTTNVSYSTSSDYRLKENVVAISDGITRLKTLKPYRFNFKADADRTVDGFFAHEVTAVPEAIAGTKDEVDSDNNPVYQGIDHSKLVPLLVAAVQELITKVETLEAA